MRFPHTSSSKLPFAVASLAIVLLSLSVITFWRASFIQRRLSEHSVIESQLDHIALQVEAQVETYIQTLYGARGFMAGSTEVTRGDWTLFYENIGVGKRLPGLAVLGFVERVPQDGLDNYVTRMRTTPGKTGLPWTGFAVNTSKATGDYYPVSYVEPMSSAIMQKALGFDFGSEPVRSAAIHKARDNNYAVMTAPIKTLDSNQTAFLLVLPVYNPNLPRTTIDERQVAFRGAVTAGFRNAELFEQMFGSLSDQGIYVEVFDGDVLDDNHRLYDSRQALPVLGTSSKDHEMVSIRTVPVADRTWTLRFTYTHPTPVIFWVPSPATRVAILLLTNLVTGLMVYHFVRLKHI